MPIQGLVFGTIKTALKRAAKSTLADAVIAGQAPDAALSNFIQSAIGDDTAVLLNRLKAAPNKDLLQYVSRETGLNNGDLRKILRLFNQTPAMREIAIGNKFKEAANQTLKPGLRPGESGRIKDLIRHAKEENATVAKALERSEQRSANKDVYNMLMQIENELFAKVSGTNQYGKPWSPKIDILGKFDPNAEYDDDAATALDRVVSSLTSDIDFYEEGEGGDVVVTASDDEGENWYVYSQENARRFVSEITSDVVRILNVYS